MKRYVDGFVIVVPKKNLKEYQKIANWAGKIWIENGALQYIECLGNDLKGMPGCLPFPKMVKAKPSETVIFSWAVFKNKKHRDTVNAKIMKDPRMVQEMAKNKPMPFDMKKMAYAGFETIVMM